MRNYSCDTCLLWGRWHRCMSTGCYNLVQISYLIYELVKRLKGSIIPYRNHTNYA